MNKYLEHIQTRLMRDHQTTPQQASVNQLYDATSKAVMDSIADDWFQCRSRQECSRMAYYFSAEFMMGRMIYNNLFAVGILDEVKAVFSSIGLDINIFEDIQDSALGTGGLGRLSACYLDSAATLSLPLFGYGLRYKDGLFRQAIENGFQIESADDWQRCGDPWSIRRDDLAVPIHFSDQTILAVAYDMPIIGYRNNYIGTLRLWEASPENEFDFQKFNQHQYADALKEKDYAEMITRVLYPNDDDVSGKILRLKQQYLLASASLQDILRRLKAHGISPRKICEYASIQLNDTHPTVAIPELIRLLAAEGISFSEAFEITCKTFNYTNHTIMSEALEKWDVKLFKSVLPQIFDIVYEINTKLCGELMTADIECSLVSIIQDTKINMANLAVYCSQHVNGVAPIHTEILKSEVLHTWYEIYPDRFQNRTNGITPRRWLGLCNPELTEFIDSRVGGECMTHLDRIALLRDQLTDESILEFAKIKRQKKCQLSEYALSHGGIDLPPDFIFDIQAKRLHEYKRQLMNALCILDIYFRIKSGELTDFPPTAFIFAAIAAPGYRRAKSIIKLISEVSRLVSMDSEMHRLMRVEYLPGYNCTYAEHIMPATDISQQISTAGSEASGSGNMKMMLNGAVTMGTRDGANVEIFRLSGEENNYVFGCSADEIAGLRGSYIPKVLYDSEPRIRRVVDALVDGTLSDGATGMFVDLYNSLLYGTPWDRADKYFVLHELLPYTEIRVKALYDTKDVIGFGRKALINVASASHFSSDRAILEYAKGTWNIK